MSCTLAAGLSLQWFRNQFCAEERRQAEAEGLLLPGWSVEWTADFFFRHFRGVVIDWVLHRGSYPLLPKLEQDYALFREIFQTR